MVWFEQEVCHSTSYADKNRVVRLRRVETVHRYFERCANEWEVTHRQIGEWVFFSLCSICNENRSLKTRQDFVPKWSHIYIMSQETSAVVPSTAETGPNAIERLSWIIFVVMLIKSIDMQLVLRTLKDTKPNHMQVVHSDKLCLFSVEKKFA